MTTTATEEARKPPPPLEQQYPLCPLCKDEVYLDDETFRCVPCGASWGLGSIGSDDGEWDADDWDNPVPQCASVIQPWKNDEDYPALRDRTFRCALSEDHLDADPTTYHSRMWDGSPVGDPLTHRSGDGHDWPEGDPAIITTAASADEREANHAARLAEGERLAAESRARWDAEAAKRRAAREMAERAVETVPVGDVL